MRKHLSVAMAGFLSVALIPPGGAGAMTFDFSCFVSTGKDTCGIETSTIQVYAFGDVTGYRFQGSCSFPNLPKKCGSSLDGSFRVMASWNESVKTASETVNGKDGGGNPWQITLAAQCQSNPWVYDRSAAACVATGINIDPNAPPQEVIHRFGVPLSPILFTPIQHAQVIAQTLDAESAQTQAPNIIHPAPNEIQGTAGSVSLQIDPGPGSPTKTLAAEWRLKEGSAWVAKNIGDTLGIGSTTLSSPELKPGSRWQLRVRAHQLAGASWSKWVEFGISGGIVKLQINPGAFTVSCAPTKAFSVTYKVTSTPTTLKVNQQVSVPLTVTNTGSAAWTIAGQFHLSYHWVGPASVFDGQRTILPNDVASCKSVALSAGLKGPAAPGTYTLQWDMVQEGVGWFGSSYGVPTGNVTVTVTP